MMTCSTATNGSMPTMQVLVQGMDRVRQLLEDVCENSLFLVCSRSGRATICHMELSCSLHEPTRAAVRNLWAETTPWVTDPSMAVRNLWTGTTPRVTDPSAEFRNLWAETTPRVTEPSVAGP